MEPVSDSLLALSGHRSPGFGVGGFTLLDLPDPSRPGEWSQQYGSRISAAESCIESYQKASVNIRERCSALRNRYALEIYEQINNLLYFSPRIVLALHKYDKLQPRKDRDQAGEIKGMQ